MGLGVEETKATATVPSNKLLYFKPALSLLNLPKVLTETSTAVFLALTPHTVLPALCLTPAQIHFFILDSSASSAHILPEAATWSSRELFPEI